MPYKKGISLISALVATIIIILGISCVVVVLQQTERMYRRTSDFQDFSLASDILFDEIQQQFGVIGTNIPDEIHGKMKGFQNLFYYVKFEKIKDNLYEVHIKITRIIEGKPYSEEFVSALSQR